MTLDLPTPPLPLAMPITVVALPSWNGDGRSCAPRPARRPRRSSSLITSMVTWTVSTPGQRREGLGHAPLDLGLQRAAGHGEPDGHDDPAVADLDVAHHPEVNDRAVQLRVVHVAQGRERGIAGRGVAHMNIRA